MFRYSFSSSSIIVVAAAAAVVVVVVAKLASIDPLSVSDIFC